jgi:hypothetical protein
MARKQVTGRGTKQERKAARRDAAKSGRSPNTPARTDRAMEGANKQRWGPRPTRSSGRGR